MTGLFLRVGRNGDKAFFSSGEGGAACRKVGEGGLDGFEIGRFNQKVQDDVFGIVGFKAADFVLAHPVLDGGQLVVADGCVELDKRGHGENRGRFDAENGCVAVSADETASAEFDAAKVTRNHHDDIGQVVFPDDFEYGIAAGATWFAVIVGFLLIGAFTKDIGRAVVAGIKIFFLYGLDEGASLFFAVNMAKMGDEFGFLYFVKRFDGIIGFFNRAVWIHTNTSLSGFVSTIIPY